MGLVPKQGGQLLLLRGDFCLQFRGCGPAGGDFLSLRRPSCSLLYGPGLLCGPVVQALIRSRVRAA